jgi:hypothetical protein
VHLNGRIYDPLIARMTSADPIVPDPMNGQARHFRCGSTISRNSCAGRRDEDGGLFRQTTTFTYDQLGPAARAGPGAVVDRGRSRPE